MRSAVPSLDEAVRRFEAGEFFEAHEAFEDAWRSSGEPRSIELHALAQLAAAMHKHHAQGMPEPARRIARRAAEKFARVQQSALGLDLEALCVALDVYVRGGSDRVERLARPSR